MEQKKFKCVFTDLDKTLLASGSIITDYTKETIGMLISKGICFVPSSGRAFNSFPKELLKMEGLKYAVTSNGVSVNEIIESGKHRGMERCCKILGISPKECIAFGDASNDMEMLQMAGLEIAVGKCKPRMQGSSCFHIRIHKQSGCSGKGTQKNLQSVNSKKDLVVLLHEEIAFKEFCLDCIYEGIRINFLDGLNQFEFISA